VFVFIYLIRRKHSLAETDMSQPGTLLSVVSEESTVERRNKKLYVLCLSESLLSTGNHSLAETFSEFLGGDWRDQTLEMFVDIVEVCYHSCTKLIPGCEKFFGVIGMHSWLRSQDVFLLFFLISALYSASNCPLV